MREPDGGAVSSYSSAAFFGGPTSSRIFLLPLTAWMTEKRAVTVYVVSALAMQAVVWISSSFLADFIAFDAYGFVMGPMYPITPSHLMPCLGQAGSAIFPFVVDRSRKYMTEGATACPRHIAGCYDICLANGTITAGPIAVIAVMIAQ